MIGERQGVVAAFVRERDAQQGRVRVEYRDIEDDLLSHWAYIASPLSGKGRGALFMPEEGDEVLICFGDGHQGHPYVVGCLWNGEQTSPETEVDNRVIVTPGGHQLRFEDKENDRRVVLSSDGGHSLTFEDPAAGKKVELESDGDRSLLLDDSGTGKVELHSTQHQLLMDDLPAGAKVVIQAGQGVGVTITMNATPQPSLSISVGAGNTLSIDSTGVTLNATGAISVNTAAAASVTIGGAANVTVGGAANFTVAGALNVTASVTNLTSGVLNVNGGIANFSGVVRCSALIAQAVVGQAYTPGLGNLI